MACSPEYRNEHWGSIKCGEFLDWLRTGQLLKKDCAARSELVMWKSHLRPLYRHFLKRISTLHIQRNTKCKIILLHTFVLSYFREYDNEMLQKCTGGPGDVSTSSCNGNGDTEKDFHGKLEKPSRLCHEQPTSVQTER